MLRNLAQLVRYRGLIQSLVARELKARYRGSVLGFFWSFINPLTLLLIYTFVFKYVMPAAIKGVDNYPLFIRSLPILISAQLTALSKVPPEAISYLQAHAADVQAAAAKTAGQWKTWYWICVGGVIFFLLSIPLLRGRWRTRDAKRDEAEHEA